jgi:hypothetical protein
MGDGLFIVFGKYRDDMFLIHLLQVNTIGIGYNKPVIGLG